MWFESSWENSKCLFVWSNYVMFEFQFQMENINKYWDGNAVYARISFKQSDWIPFWKIHLEMLLCCHGKTDLLSFKLCIQVKPVWSEMVWIWQVTQINFACVLYLWPDHFLHLLVLYVWSHVGAHLHWAAPWRLLLPTRGKAVPRHEMDGEENHSEILLHIKCGWATQQGFEVADKSSHYYRLKDVKEIDELVP